MIFLRALYWALYRRWHRIPFPVDQMTVARRVMKRRQNALRELAKR